MKDNFYFPEENKRNYGRVLKVSSLSTLAKDYEYIKKSPFDNWTEIVGEGPGANSCPLYVDKNGKRLVVAIAHSSFQISMRFLNHKIINGLKKNKGCENISEIFYAARPELFKDRYKENSVQRSEEERKKLAEAVREIKKIISDN